MTALGGDSGVWTPSPDLHHTWDSCKSGEYYSWGRRGESALRDNLRDPSVSSVTFGQSLKTQRYCSLPVSTFSTLVVSHVMHYINLRYLLT